MEWLSTLLNGPGIAHDLILVSLVIAIGIQLGKIKIFGVSLGVTMVLFFGIFLSHFGYIMDPKILHFLKEFGLILFVYSVGLQVGPGFFSSFKKGGLTLNGIAVGIVCLGVVLTIGFKFLTGLNMSTMVGILSGAVTNTPGLGAAGQAFEDMHGTGDPTISLGYAVAYPLGVIGIILTMILLRVVFRINFKKEQERLDADAQNDSREVSAASFKITNPALFEKTVAEMHGLIEDCKFVISRYMDVAADKISTVHGDTTLHEGDRLFVIADPEALDVVRNFVGEEVKMDRKQWIPTESQLVSKFITVTNGKVNGKRIGALQLRQVYGVNVTRVSRNGVDMVAEPSLPILVGDRLLVVGSEAALPKVEEMIGNSEKELHAPNLMGIFLGIAIGVLFGSIPMMIPGIPQPVKLGLAGGPLVIAILLSRFGYRYKLVTYTTHSANLMLREIGISIFLACVGLGAGEGFVETIIGGGWRWIGYGFVITVVPLIIMGIIALKLLKVNYFTLMGLLAGSMTDPPALAFANTVAPNDAPAVGYATVYPLTMFMRVLTAQVLVLFFC